MSGMRTGTLLALAASGLLWGTTVPLTKVAVADVGPAWLTVARLALAGVPLAVACRRHLRAALSPQVLVWGALGYGAVLTLQNIGVERTSVSHAALLVGALPVLVAALAASHRALRRPGPARRAGASARSPGAGRRWGGLAVALAGVVFIGADGGGTAGPTGDAVVLCSMLLNAAFLVAQPAMLRGRDPLAVTAVQLLAGALLALPAALLTEGLPPAAPGAHPVAALAGLAFGGTLVPYALFTWAQAHTTAEMAGAFLNLEPLVGVLLGTLAFGDPAGAAQITGAAAVVAGLVLVARSGRSHRRTALARRHTLAPAEAPRLAPARPAWTGRPARVPAAAQPATKW